MDSKSSRIGIFICTYDESINKRLRVKDLETYSKSLENVECVETLKFCSDNDLQTIKDAIYKFRLNKVVLAPYSNDKSLLDAIKDAGISLHLIDFANIHEEAAWIHDDVNAATDKAKILIAMAVARINSSKEVWEEGATVNEDTCSGCGICVATCRYDAISLYEKNKHRSARVDHDVCEKCGACVAACPSGSMNMGGFSNEALISEIDISTEGLLDSKEPFPRIVTFACNWCSYPAVNAAGKKHSNIDPACIIIRTPCSARVDPEWIMRALSRGADGVLVLGGKERHCHYRGGNVRTNNRMHLLSKVLESLGYDKRRLKVEWINPDEPEKLVEVVNGYADEIRNVGLNPERDVDPENRPTSALNH